MATKRRRSTHGRSSVFYPSAQRYNPRAAQQAATGARPMSDTVSRPATLGPDVASALAPRVEAFAPDFPIFDELPPVDVEPDMGYVPPDAEDEGDQGDGSQLVDAIMQEEQPLAAAPEFPQNFEYGDQQVPPSEPGESPYFAGSTFEGSLPSYDAPPPPLPQLADILNPFQKRRLEGI